MENKQALRVIYEYLMKFDIKSIIPTGNYQNHIPVTEIQQTIMRDNRDKIELFLRDLVNKEENITDNSFDEEKFKNNMFFTMWCNWIDANKIKNEFNSVSFGTRLGILIKKKKIAGGNDLHPASENPETEVESPHRKGASAPPPQERGGGDVSELLDVEQSPTGQVGLRKGEGGRGQSKKRKGRRKHRRSAPSPAPSRTRRARARRGRGRRGSATTLAW